MRLKRVELLEAYENIFDQCRLEAFAHRHPDIASNIHGRHQDRRRRKRVRLSTNGEERQDADPDRGSEETFADADHDGESDSNSGNSSSSTLSEGEGNNDSRDERSELSERTISEETGSHSSESEDDGGGGNQDNGMVGWTDTELDVFFKSLSRHSRLFPDRISQDLGNSKSTSQVAHLLTLLRRTSDRYEGDFVWREERSSARRRERRSRRIGRCKAAHEMSDDWIKLEEKLASRLQRMQELDDAEDNEFKDVSLYQLLAEGDAEDGEVNKVKNSSQRSLVSWDTQVINAMLFLRHHPRTSPDTNKANLSYSIPLAEAVEADQDQGTEADLFAVSAATCLELFTTSLHARKQSASLSRSYRAFASLHPCPNTQFGSAKEAEIIAWRVLYRAAELGIIAWLRVRKEVGSDATTVSTEIATYVDRTLRSTQNGTKKFYRHHKGSFVWTDTLLWRPKQCDAAKRLIEGARQEAAQRLRGSLEWGELLQICLCSQKSSDSPTRTKQLSEVKRKIMIDQNKNANTFFGVDISWCQSKVERRRVKARLEARVRRYGLQVARSMPLEAQKTGRKRKRSNGGSQQEVLPADPHSAISTAEREQPTPDRIGKEASEMTAKAAEGNVTGAQDKNNRSDSVSLPEHTSNLPRFGQIGMTVVRMYDVLHEEVKSNIDLFRVQNLKRLALDAYRQDSQAEGCRIEGISQGALQQLSSLLHSYLRSLMMESISTASCILSNRGQMKQFIQRSHIRSAAIRLQEDIMPAFRRDTGTYLSRSDPAQAHDLLPVQMQRKMGICLQGLNSLSSSSSLLSITAKAPCHTNSCFVTDGIVAPEDGFNVTMSSQYVRQRHSSEAQDMLVDDQSEMDSEESSVYDDSDQEREIQFRKDEEKGVPREDRRVDGRRWDYNEKREEEERQHWRTLEKSDAKESEKYENSLWAIMGLKAKRKQSVDHIDHQDAEDDESSDDSSLTDASEYFNSSEDQAHDKDDCERNTTSDNENDESNTSDHEDSDDDFERDNRSTDTETEAHDSVTG